MREVDLPGGASDQAQRTRNAELSPVELWFPAAGPPCPRAPIPLRTVVAAVIILTAVILVITAPHRPQERVQEPVPSPGEV